MTLACLFPWVSKRNRSPSTLHIHVLSSENWNGQLVETQDGSKIRFFSFEIILKRIYFPLIPSLTNGCGIKVQGKSIIPEIDAAQDSPDEWVYAKQQKWKKNLAGQEKERSPDILQKQDKSLQTAVTAYTTISPTCFFFFSFLFFGHVARPLLPRV